MRTMVITSPRGKQIVFDDFCEDADFDIIWVEMCRTCMAKYRGILGQRPDDGGTACATCSVAGCEKEADYYVDFKAKEVEFLERTVG